MTILRAGGASDVGRVREINEDRFLIEDDLFVVADGVGGHQAGEVASQTSVEAMRDAFTEPDTRTLVDAVHHANEVVWHLAQSAREKRGMGTTLTAAALVKDPGSGDERLAVVNVGDSRAYLMQRGELMQVSEDHSLVEEMVRDGRITSQEALVHPKRSIITRALGMEPDIEVDSWELIPYEGDRLLLCSDGLTNELSEDRIAAILRQIADPDEAAKDLVREARAAGGNDNITVVVIDVVDDDNRAGSASAALAGEPKAAPSPRPVSTSSSTAIMTDPVAAGLGADQPATPPSTPNRRPSPRLVDDPLLAGRRRFTWRSGVFVIFLVGVLLLAVGAVGWYARSTWYVGLDESEKVAVFRGRPGGLLWFQPTLEESRNLTLDQVGANYRQDLREGKQFPSKKAADRFVNQVRLPPTTTTTTTTTLPPPTPDPAVPPPPPP